jgi:hypothetical protein
MVELSVRRLRTLTSRTALPGLLADGRLTLGVTAFLAVGGLALANGGYFPVAWGWSGLALFWLAAITLLVGAGVYVGFLEWTLLGSLAGLAAWTFLSIAWTSSAAKTVHEGERTLVYLAAGLAGVLLLRRVSGPALVKGIWAAITVISAYGLATRLFPQRLGTFDPIAGNRLSEPLGYWNAFGVLAAMGTLLALGLAARSGPVVRCLAAASTVVTLLTLYFTFSRGGWIAFFIGLAVAIAIDRRRLQLITTGLVLTPWPVLAIWAASQSGALTHVKASVQAAARDGHGLAVIALGLMVAGALSILALDWLEASLRIPYRLQRLYAGTLAFVLAATLIAIFGRYGLPPTLARKAYHAFNASPPETTNLNSRLFNFSGSGRSEHWHTAWQEVEAHPWLGSGAGSFDVYWFQHRRVAVTVHDAHNLYLETVAELGPVGLALLAGVLGVPFIAVVRARRSPLAAVAFGAYVAYVLHAAVDWDWEMPAVTLAALFCGLVVLASARGDDRLGTLRAPARFGGLAATVGIAAFVLLGLLGNGAVSASSKSASAGNWEKAESQARRAMHFASWSPEPWRRLGEAQAGAGHLAAARASFRKAIAKDSGDWTLWFELAAASRGPQRARALNQAFRLNPLSPELDRLRGQAQRRK